jgi:hypothetical protein
VLALRLSALVIETNDIHEILTHPDEGSLYVFDLDNTLIEPHQHLGSDQWVEHQLKSLTKQGSSIEAALQVVIPCYIDIQNKIEMKLVDPSIPTLFSKLQEKKASAIGLTKRGPEMAERTLKQLEPLHIDFGATAPLKGSPLSTDIKGTCCKKGIIFVARGEDKGPSLVAYLKKLEKLPKRVIMVDDKMSHLTNIEKALEPLNIPFIGLRYGVLDEKVKAFNSKVADLQLKHLHKVLSDEQALHLLQLNEKAAN